MMVQINATATQIYEFGVYFLRPNSLPLSQILISRNKVETNWLFHRDGVLQTTSQTLSGSKIKLYKHTSQTKHRCHSD